MTEDALKERRQLEASRKIAGQICHGVELFAQLG